MKGRIPEVLAELRQPCLEKGQQRAGGAVEEPLVTINENTNSVMTFGMVSSTHLGRGSPPSGVEAPLSLQAKQVKN